MKPLPGRRHGRLHEEKKVDTLVLDSVCQKNVYEALWSRNRFGRVEIRVDHPRLTCFLGFYGYDLLLPLMLG